MGRFARFKLQGAGICGVPGVPKSKNYSITDSCVEHLPPPEVFHCVPPEPSGTRAFEAGTPFHTPGVPYNHMVPIDNSTLEHLEHVEHHFFASSANSPAPEPVAAPAPDALTRPIGDAHRYALDHKEAWGREIEARPDLPREWAEGFGRMVTMPDPKAYAAERWAQILTDAYLFLGRHGAQAAQLGWDTVAVFGVGKEAPELSQDQKGLVVLVAGWTVTGITAQRATVMSQSLNKLSIYRRPAPAGTVLIWDM